MSKNKFITKLETLLEMVSNTDTSKLLEVINSYMFDNNQFKDRQLTQIVKELNKEFGNVFELSLERDELLFKPNTPTEVVNPTLTKDVTVSKTTTDTVIEEQKEVEELKEITPLTNDLVKPESKITDLHAGQGVITKVVEDKGNVTNPSDQKEKTQPTNSTPNNEGINNMNNLNNNQSFTDSSFVASLKKLGYTEEILETTLTNAWRDLEINLPSGVTGVLDNKSHFINIENYIQYLEREGKNDEVETISEYLLKNSPRALEEAVINNFSGDSALSSKWIALGTAVIGSGLEHYARGEVTIGSVAGGVAGATAAYFVADKVVKKVDSDSNFVNMSLAGTIGLGLGAGVTALGRVAGSKLLSRGSNDNNEEEQTTSNGEVHITINNPTPVVTSYENLDAVAGL